MMADLLAEVPGLCGCEECLKELEESRKEEEEMRAAQRREGKCQQASLDFRGGEVINMSGISGSAIEG